MHPLDKDSNSNVPLGPIVRVIEVYFVLAMLTVLGWALLMPADGMGLLVAAAACFVAGLVFYMFRHIPYLWFVSHLLVLGGSVCLFLSVVLFVI